jgi:hypothetical protein
VDDFVTEPKDLCRSSEDGFGNFDILSVTVWLLDEKKSPYIGRIDFFRTSGKRFKINRKREEELVRAIRNQSRPLILVAEKGLGLRPQSWQP